jgi:nitrogen fixation protein FixH
MSLAAHRPQFRLTGWHVLAGFIAFFGVTIAVDVLMAVQAYRTYPGEVATSPYEDGLAYDSQLDQQRIQTGLGWRFTVALQEHGVVRVTATDRRGSPLADLKLAASLTRPATEQGRREISFRAMAPGQYEARAGVLSGAWDLKVSAYDSLHRRFDVGARLVGP